MKTPKSVNKTIKKIFTSKYTLNLMFVVAFVNLLCLIMCGKEKQVALFFLVGFLTSFFSNNMIIVLGLPMLLVNLDLLGSNSLIEGMDDMKDHNSKDDKHDNKKKKKVKQEINNDDTDTDTDNDTDTDSDNDSDEGMTNQPKKNSKPKKDLNKTLSSSSYSSLGNRKSKGIPHSKFTPSPSPSTSGKKNDIDYAATVEESFKDMEKTLGSSGMKRLGGDTKNLIKQQKGLQDTMEQMAPLVDGVGPLVDKMGGVIESLGGAEGMSKLANIASAFAPKDKEKN